MGAQRHSVKRQVLELTLDKTRDAWPLQQELSRIYRQRIVPLIERYCDELSAPDRLHRIDRLELDLGPVDPDQLEADLVAKVDAALRRRLAEQIGGQESAAIPPDKTPKTTSQLELFSLFARQGSLPWWADLTQPQLLEDSLHYLLHHAPDRLRRLLRELAGEENPLQRLIQHYDDRRLTALATLLTPALAAFLAPLPRILTAACQYAEELAWLPPSRYEISPLPVGEANAFAGYPKKSQLSQVLGSRTGLQAQLRRHVWHSILQVAALSEEPYREPLPFCRAVLLQLAGVLRLPYTALLTGLRQVLSTPATGVHSQLNWSSLDEAEPAERNPGSPGYEQSRRRHSLDEAELAERNPGSPDHEQNLHSWSSLDEAEPAQRNPGSPGHDHRLDHINRQESQLAEVNSDAKEGAGRNDDQGLPPAVFDRRQAAVQQSDVLPPEVLAKPASLQAAAVDFRSLLKDIVEVLAEKLAVSTLPQRDGAPAATLLDRLEFLADRLPDLALRTLFPAILSQLPQAARAQLLTRLQPLLDTAPASDLLAKLQQWLQQSQADLPPAVFDCWQAAVQQLDALPPEVLARPALLQAATVDFRSPLKDIAEVLTEEPATPALPQRDGAPAAALLDRLESLTDRLPDPALRTLFPSLLVQLPEAARAQLLTRLQPLLDTAPAGDLLAELQQWLQQSQADLPSAIFDRWQAAVQQSDARAAMQHPADRYQTDTASIDLSFSDADELYIDNAGLVILWPFLGRFFERLGLVTENRFQDAAAVQRAVGLLQYLATEDPSPPEYLLPLNKVLCGMELDQVFVLEPPLTEAEMAECTQLLSAVIEHAPILHSMSIPGFRGTFLLRQGILGQRDGAWLLQVERETYDIVLDRFPWGMEWVKLPWMTAPLRVEW